MIREAEKYAEQDRAAEERVTAITTFENYLDSAEGPLSSGGYESLSDEDRKAIKDAVKKGRDFLSGSWSAMKVEEVKKQHNEAEKVIGGILGKIYGDSGGGRKSGDDDDDDDDDNDDDDNYSDGEL